MIENRVMRDKPLNLLPIERDLSLWIGVDLPQSMGQMSSTERVETGLNNEAPTRTPYGGAARGGERAMDTAWIAGTQIEQRVSLAVIAERLTEFEEAGVDLVLLQFNPQYEEMERFAAEVIPLVNDRAVGKR